MLRSMNVYARAYLAADVFPRGAAHDFLNREILPARLLLVQKRTGQKYLDSARNICQHRV
jgi:hypothetical protein